MALTPDTYPNGHGGQKVNDQPQPDTWHALEVDNVPQFFEVQLPNNFPREWRDLLDDLILLWHSKLSRNYLKMKYYDMKNSLKDIGIAIPPQLTEVNSVVGWPKKAVNSMAQRCHFDGFLASDANTQTILDGIVKRSKLRLKYDQAVKSTLVNSCCFATVTMDNAEQPRIDFYDATRAAARWDDAAGRIAYGMVFNEIYRGVPVDITLYTDDAAVNIWFTGSAVWAWDYQPYNMGRPTMAALVYEPTLNRPFGQSRINRTVISLTDSAVREAVRAEIGAEFFTSPQKYLLGADNEAFQHKSKWEAYIGNIFAVSRDENGQLPEFGQLSQGTMQPHIDYMRSLAALFSGETNVPMSQLGIIHDNPASAEAIYAASEPLIIECEQFNNVSRESLSELAQMCMAAELDTPMDNLDERYTDFSVNFANPAMPSIVSQADAMVKIASVTPGFSGTDVFFEQIGFSEATRRRALAEIRENADAEASNAALTAIFGGGVSADTA